MRLELGNATREGRRILCEKKKEKNLFQFQFQPGGIVATSKAFHFTSHWILSYCGLLFVLLPSCPIVVMDGRAGTDTHS